MKNTKKLSVIIAMLFMVTPCNNHGMEEQPSTAKKIGWVVLAGAVLVGGYVAYKKFLSYIHEEEPEGPFAGLPSDKQKAIIELLASNSVAKTLKEAAQTINSLAQVNKELNRLINDPKYCLQLIKGLAKRFNCSDEEAAAALKTKEAQRRLELQDNLFNLCTILPKHSPDRRTVLSEVDILSKLSELESLSKQGVDLNFVYHKPSYGQMTLLMMVVCENNCPMIKMLLNHGADINTVNSYGTTALRLAVAVQKSNAVKCLVSNSNILIDQQDNEGNTALMYAIFPLKYSPTELCKSIIKQLLDAGADPEIANNKGLTPLKEAQQIGKKEIIDLITKDVPFLTAAKQNNCSLIKKLLDEGADINAADSDGNTALIFAAWKGHTDVVECLVDNPAIKIDQPNGIGSTALMFAAEENHCPIINILLNKGANINAANSKYGDTALIYAATKGHADAVECLLSNSNIVIDQPDNNENTALIAAAQQNNCPIIQIFLNKGANINHASSKYGNTALMWAVLKGHADAVECLLSNSNIKKNQQNNAGNTALLLAVVKRNKVIVKQLLDADADPEIANKKGLTPRNAAMRIKTQRGYNPATATAEEIRHTPIKIEADVEIQSLINKAILKKHGVVTPFIKNKK